MNTIFFTFFNWGVVFCNTWGSHKVCPVLASMKNDPGMNLLSKQSRQRIIYVHTSFLVVIRDFIWKTAKIMRNNWTFQQECENVIHFLCWGKLESLWGEIEARKTKNNLRACRFVPSSKSKKRKLMWEYFAPLKLETAISF